MTGTESLSLARRLRQTATRRMIEKETCLI
ncbi:hypothetical protein LHK_02242 [Laribacter hongkongensis HLHK9]|uniref:Uncharacterized protein n=1 Tax=Laribacter hongkongensis (strain HLHK9) TaxID=557598 RepID=C1DAB1_LARHH|nr:hypothetical protein LHK_02242 [Laribacter hongkongensis HLHK9]